MIFGLFKKLLCVLALCGVFVASGCFSDSAPAPTQPTDTTSIETCFDVTISSSGSSNTSSVCVTDENNRVNGLGVYRFIRFNVAGTQTMTFTVSRTSGLNPADPDIQIFKTGSGEVVTVGLGQSVVSNTEALTRTLTAGDYVLQIYEDKYTLDNFKPLAPPLKLNSSNTASKLNQQTSYFAPSPACTPGTITIGGVVTYDLIPHSINNGLDYNNITAEPVKNAVVELICEGSVSSTANTDNNGNYSFSAPANISNVFVRVKAQMLRESPTPPPSYNFSVVDNTQTQSLYAMDSAAFNIGTVDILDKDLHAQSGWTGTSYGSDRVAAPFAILDSVRVAMNKVINVNSSSVFPALRLNWSVYNTTATGSLAAGQITSSHYNGVDIYILGAADNDTDEYDDHVIIHEWWHYFEDNFSRLDSIGGEHAGGDILDVRVAFSEGFGNAYSAIASGDVVYRDSNGVSQTSGFGFSLENNNCLNPGWYSECSVQSIFYDLFDTTNDGADTVSLGFGPIYNVLTIEQKNTIALTSIFSFIKPLKDNNASVSNAIDTLIAGQNIDAIMDIYGDSELSNNPGSTNQLPIFKQM